MEILEEYYWASHPTLTWVPAKKLTKTDTEILVETDDGNQLKIPIKDAINVHSSCLKGVEDLLMLGDFNEQTSLHNIRVRYQRDEIYTAVGTPILISLNPYKKLDIYSSQTMQQYKKQSSLSINTVQPHLFQIGELAYQQLFEQNIDNTNQAVIISGESGSGKTEATKIILKYLTQEKDEQAKKPSNPIMNSNNNKANIITPSNQSQQQNTKQQQQQLQQQQQQLQQSKTNKVSIEEQILVSNPLLEAFGNAKTVRNDNSSRFGKFIRIFYNCHRKIHSAQIVNYLLEKCRVVKINSEERTYHIFYQIFCGVENDPDFQKKYHLKSLDDYVYLKNGDLLHQGDDETNFKNTLQCMDVLGFSEEEKDSIFKIISGILQIGNFDFVSTQDEGSELKQRSLLYLQYAQNLLGIDKEQIKELLVTKKINDCQSKSKTPITTKQTAEQACYNRDALSKFIYAKLFDYLIDKVTKTLLKPYNKQTDGQISEIGLLDIFGFEIFKENSFEQLCINFANEKLQQHFNQHMFKLEQQEYKNEKIEWDHIKFVDNQTTIDLFEKPNPSCIFSLLDDECRVPKGSDKNLLEALSKKISNSQFFMNNSQKLLQACFGVKHFAGDVHYDVANFVDKNKDTANDEFSNILSTSKNYLVAKLFEPSQQQQQNCKSPQQSSGKQNTVSVQFRNQLNDLLQQLQSSHPFYIRCIKPNNDKQPNVINSQEVLRQLRCAGLLEAIRIRKAGYAVRRSHLEFLKIYKMLQPSLQIKTPLIQVCRQFMDNLQKIEIFSQKLNPKLKLYQIGEKTVYMKEEIKALLDSQLSIFQKKYIIKIQKVYKGYKQKIVFKHIKKCVVRIQKRTLIFVCKKRMQKRIKKRKLDKNISFFVKLTKIFIKLQKKLKAAQKIIQQRKAEQQLKLQEQLELQKQKELELQQRQIEQQQQNNDQQQPFLQQEEQKTDQNDILLSKMEEPTQPNQFDNNNYNNNTNNLMNENNNNNNNGESQNNMIFNIQNYLSQIPPSDNRLQELEDKLNLEQQQRQKIEEELNQIRFSRLEDSAESQLLNVLKEKLKSKLPEGRDSIFKTAIQCNSIEDLINNFNDADSEIQKLKIKLESTEKKIERMKKERESQINSETQLKQQQENAIKKYIDENFKLQKEFSLQSRKFQEFQSEIHKLQGELSIKNEVIKKIKEQSCIKQIDSQLENKKLKELQKEFQEQLQKREDELNENVEKIARQDKIITDQQQQITEIKTSNYEMQNKITLFQEEVKSLSKENVILKQELQKLQLQNQSTQYKQQLISQQGGSSSINNSNNDQQFQQLQSNFQQLHNFKDHLVKENQASKEICQTLINLLKWKNIEVEHIKKNIVVKEDNAQNDLYKELSSLKSKEKVLTEKLEKQLQTFQELEMQKEKYDKI